MHASELDSALFNFLTNSIKAMERAGTDQQKICVSTRSEWNFTVISLEDNGVGVSEDVKDRVSEPVFSTSESDGGSISGTGTGLGLRIVSDITSTYGGNVTLSDQPSSGYTTTFDYIETEGNTMNGFYIDGNADERKRISRLLEQDKFPIHPDFEPFAPTKLRDALLEKSPDLVAIDFRLDDEDLSANTTKVEPLRKFSEKQFSKHLKKIPQLYLLLLKKT